MDEDEDDEFAMLLRKQKIVLQEEKNEQFLEIKNARKKVIERRRI